ncbi:FecCD family ABC transporter permease [Rhodobacter sp. NSM]|uniref:FecCD family ABC transporter permease n=1 Tax=Rhodobacter sp. NSM TaxID=3457501 RepID=UPI003FD499F6
MSGPAQMRGVALALLVPAAALVALAWGQVGIGPRLLWEGLTTGDGPGALTLSTFRGPRVAIAIAAGALLGASGALLQSLFRNPLASPDIIGFTQGAGLAVIAATAFGLGGPMPLIAAAGGLAAAALVGLASWRPGHVTPPLTMVLVGLGAAFLCSALSTFLMTLMPSAAAAEAQRWITGSLAGSDWTQAARIWPAGLLLLALALAACRPLAALQLGEDLAVGLGTNLGPARWSIVVAAVALAAAAVAVAGPVPFVALMAPPLGIRFTGARRLPGQLLSAAAAGAIVLTLADASARSLLPGIELPAGVMTGILGAPYLMWRLARETKKGSL